MSNLSEEPHKLRQLANEIEYYLRLRNYVEQNGPAIVEGAVVKVTWDVGAGLPGYDEARAALAADVKLKMQKLLADAVERERFHLDAIRNEIKGDCQCAIARKKG